MAFHVLGKPVQDESLEDAEVEQGGSPQDQHQRLVLGAGGGHCYKEDG
eukprot:CAMPEP_0170549736 /NCGR_PEP_ID=MMETSP0211-20121228/7886_1 /TAXON_ID=311385 /ORGANISM="Pseudokeronopsis sp., Strain OXSARD2" /LENGTH=47 /DNA_ID= /DNA_START= /DNA_END= /DNA_ORIENTATION=